MHSPANHDSFRGESEVLVIRITTLSAALALSACANLSAVRDVSTKLTTASKTWNAVHGDYEGSCKRLMQINPAVADCTTQAAASKGLGEATKVLTGYFKALQDTANEENYSIQPGIDNLSGSVQNIPGVNADQVQAVTGLAGLLSRLALNGYRENTLRLLIGDGVPPARRVIGLLRTSVPSTLGASLVAERTQLTGQFASYIQQGGGTIGNVGTLCETGPRTANYVNSGTNFLLALEYCRRLSDVTAKETALEQYSKSLDAAEKALNELASAKTQLGAKELARRLYTTGKELDDSIDAVEDAFRIGGEHERTSKPQSTSRPL